MRNPQDTGDFVSQMLNGNPYYSPSGEEWGSIWDPYNIQEWPRHVGKAGNGMDYINRMFPPVQK